MAESTDNPGDRRPLIVAVDWDDGALARVTGELERRYGTDYRVAGHPSAAAALEHLGRLARAGDEVALVVSEQWLAESTGAELLARVNEIYPLAKRGLLIEWGAWGDRATADAIGRAMTFGHIDYYVPKPWHTPDEFFHRTVTEFLHEWVRSGDSMAKEVVVVGPRRSVRAQELRGLLTRNGVPHAFRSSDSDDGRRLLEDAGYAHRDVPVVRLLSGQVLLEPSNAELASAFGLNTTLADEGKCEYDVIVVGAGPAGLAASVYASSEGLHTLTVEADALGGQAGSSSLIRNYLGFSRGVSGAELAQRAYQQAWVFGTRFLHTRRATHMSRREGRHVLRFSDGTEATARAVVLATGASYRRMTLPAVEELTNSGVYYGASTSEAQTVAGEDIYVVGGGNSAGQAAMHLCRFARSVTLLVRGRSLAPSMSRYLSDQLAAAPKVEVLINTQVANAGGAGRLEWLKLRDRSSRETWTVEAGALFVLIGARPHTDWLPPSVQRDPWGYLVTGADLPRDTQGTGAWPLERAPLMLETSLPGVFAAGDVRHRSVKRVASAVGEGSVVVQQVHQHLASGDEDPARPTEAAASRRRDGGSSSDVESLAGTSR